jgi:glycosyltransferase involved in cell wall biosynthesis
MHVVQMGFNLDPQRRAPTELLAAWYSLEDTANAAASAGCRVSIILASHLTATISRGNVSYEFLPAAARPFDRDAGNELLQVLRPLQPDVIHIHGLGFNRHVAALSQLMPGVPIMVQDHASWPPRPWNRRAWRRGHRKVAAVSFCAMEQAQAFLDARLFAPHTAVLEIPESTTRFTPGDQTAARRITGVTGSPALLWVGHLDRNKDPLTVLQGFERIVQQLPQATLSMCFGKAPLMPEIAQLLNSRPALAARVQLLGEVSHSRVQTLMHAADYFVLASHREGSGYSLIEALATGLTPIVTDIPSFRSLTGNGAAGALWSCDDATSFVRAFMTSVREPVQQLRARALTQFENHLSMAALGRKLRAAYEGLA